MIKQFFMNLNFMICHLISLLIVLWQKTGFLRSAILKSDCRFYPSCSDYFIQSIKTHGLFKGFFISLKRIVRCNPLCTGGIDEVMERS